MKTPPNPGPLRRTGQNCKRVLDYLFSRRSTLSPQHPSDPMSMTGTGFDDRFAVIEVADPRYFADRLFRECFGHSVPNHGRHFIAFYTWPDERVEVLGYVNFTAYRNVYRGGGMCVKRGAYRRLPEADRAELRKRGGIAQCLLGSAANVLKDAVALFGYVGDKTAENVDLRAGYQHTGHPHLIVRWQRELDPATRRALVEEVAALGPF